MKKQFLTLLLLIPLLATAQGLRLSPRPVTGAEHLLSSAEYMSRLEGRLVGLVANQSSLVGSTHLVDTLLSRGVRLRAIYAPEHGFRGQVEAGYKVSDSKDPKTGLPIYSLYGKNRKPAPEQLAHIDLMLFDLQDVGCRFYTYISTLTYVMEACAERGIPLLVLDRPNPNAHYVDGPILEPAQQSFVGMHPVPIVYGMTIGEYARMVLGEGWLWMSGSAATNQWQKIDSAEYARRTARFTLEVVPLRRYNHQMPYSLPVPPSPNLPNDQAVALYPTLCLFEGTTLSVGRGTDWPFQVIGQDSCRLDLRKAPVGPQLHLDWVIEMYRCKGQQDFFLRNRFFDRLAGTAALRQQIQAGHSDQEIHLSWNADLQRFRKVREHYLLYPDPQPQH